MYAFKLILRYLRKRRIAWVSLIAVTLCTAMVLIVISIMGGWLRMFRESAHGLSGDIMVTVENPAGFPFYQEMIDRIDKLNGVGEGGAVPVIRTFGLINIGNKKKMGVQIFGFPIDKIGTVNAFPQSLYRQYNQYIDKADNDKSLTKAQREALRAQAAESAKHPSFALPLTPDQYRDAYVSFNSKLIGKIPDSQFKDNTDRATNWPGLIAGIYVLNIHKDDDTGEFVNRNEGLYSIPVSLTVLGLDAEGSIDLKNTSTRSYWIVDDSRTKVWQYDLNSVYVPFDVLQKELGMDAHGEMEARANELYIRVLPGHKLDEVRAEVDAIVKGVYAEKGYIAGYATVVQTWEEAQAQFISAIEHEKLLVTILFGIISIVAIFLIFCIFYMIVVEKTRDIGIIKSVGASSLGVAGIFLGYGLAIGIVGAGLGFLAAWGFVANINELHTWLGKHTGMVVWKPSVYQFDTIPNTMNPNEVIVILSIAVLASVLGALVPAIRAARMHPIEALRWE